MPVMLIIEFENRMFTTVGKQAFAYFSSSMKLKHCFVLYNFQSISQCRIENHPKAFMNRFVCMTKI